MAKQTKNKVERSVRDEFKQLIRLKKENEKLEGSKCKYISRTVKGKKRKKEGSSVGPFRGI